MSFFGASDKIDMNRVVNDIKNGLDINMNNNYLCRSLINATRYGHTDTVKYLVNHGVDVNQTNHNGDTALILSIIYGVSDITKFLIDNGADINKSNRQGKTAISEATSYPMCNVDSMKLVIPLANMSHFDIKQMYEYAKRYQRLEVLNQSMISRDIDRYLAFCELFSIGTYDTNQEEGKNEMLGYEPPENEDDVRPFPPMFDSNSNDSSFDATLAGVIFEYARDSLEGELIITME